MALKCVQLGTSRHAKHTINSKDIRWADHVFVMEQKHKLNLKEKFRNELQHKRVTVLDIPDDFQYMDKALIKLLQPSMLPYLP